MVKNNDRLYFRQGKQFLRSTHTLRSVGQTLISETNLYLENSNLKEENTELNSGIEKKNSELAEKDRQIQKLTATNIKNTQFIKSICDNMKINVICKICNQVFNEPVNLPCNNIVCKSHLTDLNNENCSFCQNRHELSTNEAKSNEMISQILNKSFYLTNEEIELQQKVTSLFDEIKIKSETLRNKEPVIEVLCYDHFASIINKIDRKKEELKIEIDDLADNLLNRVKNCRLTHEEGLKFISSKKVLSFQEIIDMECELKQDARKIGTFNASFEDVKTKLEQHISMFNEKIDALLDTELRLEMSSINLEASKLKSKVFGKLKLKKSALLTQETEYDSRILDRSFNTGFESFSAENN